MQSFLEKKCRMMENLDQALVTQTPGQQVGKLSHKIKTVEDYQIEIIDPNSKCDTSYEIIKSFRECQGEEDKYVSW